MVKQKYLIIRNNHFIDPHGSLDDGGETKEIAEGEYYDKIYKESLLEENQDKSFDGDEWIDSDELSGSEDGYNAEVEFWDIKPITDEQAIVYKEIINKYKQIQ